jgi:hypothetical protein
MADSPVIDHMQKWRDLVGGFILAFGDIARDIRVRLY